MEFSNWITSKFVEWRGKKIGYSGSVAEFAKLFGASQQIMSIWMKPGGKVPKSQKYITALANVYGSEIYEVLGLPVPEAIDIPFESLPSGIRTSFAAAAAEIKSAFASRQISDPDSPEGQSLAISIFEKHGFKVTTIR